MRVIKYRSAFKVSFLKTLTRIQISSLKAFIEFFVIMYPLDLGQKFQTRRNVFFITISKNIIETKKLLKQSFIRNNYIRLKIFAHAFNHIVDVIFLVFKLLEEKTFSHFLSKRKRRGRGRYIFVR